MIYLDYVANTPPAEEVVNTYAEICRRVIANPNSHHQLGMVAMDELQGFTAQIARLMGVKANEVIYTSSASEANNLAIKGIANQYKKYGKHIITSYLAHSSVNGAIAALVKSGWEVDYVELQSDGLVDMAHLKELLREDTVLLSVGAVDSEIGITQNIEELGKLVSAYPHCFFHVDATQAVGKIPLSLENVHLLSFAPHKFYGLNGSGILIKKDGVMLEPLIHGGSSLTPFRSGTPDIAMAAATAKALELALAHMTDRLQQVETLNNRLRAGLKRYSAIKINSTDHSVPYILNISIPGVKTEELQWDLGERGIFVSTKSACCAPNTVSRPVYALTKDKKAALSTLRISLSHLTTDEEIELFLGCFDDCYRKLIK